MSFESQTQKKYGSGGGAGGVFGDVYVMLPEEINSMDIEKVGRFDIQFQLPDLRPALRVSHFFG